MNHQIVNNEDWLKAYANLMYAFMFADKNIHREEKIVVRDPVENTAALYSLDKNAKEFIYNELKTLIEKRERSEIAFELFQAYFLKNKNVFTDEIKLSLMKSSDEIASAFRGKNKSELVFLNRLLNLLRK